MAAALGYRADGTGARLCFDVHNGNYDTTTLIGVLERLADFYAGQQPASRWCWCGMG